MSEPEPFERRRLSSATYDWTVRAVSDRGRIQLVVEQQTRHGLMVTALPLDAERAEEIRRGLAQAIKVALSGDDA